MVSASGAKKPVITQSKINHKSPVLHPLARFVTIVAIIKPLLPQTAVEQLREVYKQQQYYWENF